MENDFLQFRDTVIYIKDVKAENTEETIYSRSRLQWYKIPVGIAENKLKEIKCGQNKGP